MGNSKVLGFISVFIEVTMIALNLLTMYAGGYVKAQRDKSDIDDIIVSLSACTIGFVLFSTPFGLMTYFRNGIGGGTETCEMFQVSATWYQLFCVFLISSLVINCVRRGKILVQSQFLIRIWKRAYVYIAVMFVLIFTLSVSVLPLLGLAPDIRNSTDLNKSCHLWISMKSIRQKEKIFTLTYLSIGCLNFLFLIICMPLIFHYIRRVKRQMWLNLCSQECNFLMESDIIRRRYIDNSRMVTLVGAMFYFSWIPNMVMVGLNQTNHVVSETAILYAILGTTMTGLLNPLTYAYWDKSYRNGYKRALERIIRCCTCNKYMKKDIPDVSLKTTSISHQSTILEPADSSACYKCSAYVDTKEQSAVNPACKDLLTNTSQDADYDNIQISCEGANAIQNKVYDNQDYNCATDSYSIESDCALFISEGCSDVLEDNLRHKPRSHRRLSETSESSLNTDNDSLEPFTSYNVRYVDESIM